MKVYPFEQVLKSADEVVEKGGTVYQQFNCAHCGAKQTMDVENTFFEAGTCEECGKETNIRKDGHNFMAMFGGKIK
jgi:hypothetical protein